jgi:hypothetical protein
MKKYSFGLLELEMADLERFWRKTPLGPLGVKLNSLKYNYNLNDDSFLIFIIIKFESIE